MSNSTQASAGRMPRPIGEYRMGGMPQPGPRTSSRKFGAGLVVALATVGALSAYYVTSSSHSELISAAPVVAPAAPPPVVVPEPLPAEPPSHAPVTPEKDPAKHPEPAKATPESEIAPSSKAAPVLTTAPAKKLVVPGEGPKMRMTESSIQAKPVAEPEKASPQDLVITKLTRTPPIREPEPPVVESAPPKVETVPPASEPKPASAPAPSTTQPNPTNPPTPEPPTSPPPKLPADV